MPAAAIAPPQRTGARVAVRSSSIAVSSPTEAPTALPIVAPTTVIPPSRTRSTSRWCTSTSNTGSRGSLCRKGWRSSAGRTPSSPAEAKSSRAIARRPIAPSDGQARAWRQGARNRQFSCTMKGIALAIWSASALASSRVGQSGFWQRIAMPNSAARAAARNGSGSASATTRAEGRRDHAIR
jgi:hypothetical protein